MKDYTFWDFIKKDRWIHFAIAVGLSLTVLVLWYR